MKYDKRGWDKERKVIMLDMDGVLVDFNRQYFEWCEKEHIKYHSDHRDWDAIDLWGQDFWATMKWTKWGRELYEYCTSKTYTCLLTSPSNSPSSAMGKMAWINREVKTRDFLVGGAKWATASKDHILIDDSEKKCVRFQSAGGRIYVFDPNKDYNLINLKKYIEKFINNELL